MQRRIAAALTLLTGAVALATCDEHASPANVDEVVYSCEDAPSGQPFASDESWTKFVEAEAAGKLMADDCRAPSLTAPAAGTSLDRNTPAAFNFTAMPASCTQAAGSDVRKKDSGAPAPGSRWWRRLVKVVSPIGVAHAHCPAVEGPNYVLRIADASDKTVYSALLSVTSFTPNADIWKKTVGGRAGQMLRVTIQRGVFARGNIIEGPFMQKQPLTFTVAP